ncbi:uncharacterized protein LOC142639733 [Castanea sativa]|uniref:uncharacterized protein LOC142639733 n=1 Tax=Castanea sativa TaxID=21020 RepID=UPI003F654032
MEATCPSSASYAWKSIIKGRDGKSIHIWGDRWLPHKHSPLVLSPQVEGLAEAKVQSLIDEDQRCWKTDLIDGTLLDFEATMVKSIPLCLTDQPDELIWPHSVKRAYTIKTSYRFLQTEFQNQQPGQSKPLMLKPLWKGIYSLNHEDTLHALYLCLKLEEIWLSVQAWNRLSLQQTTSFVGLMGCILVENRDLDLFAMVVWVVWKRRNDMRVGKRDENLPNLVQQACSKLHDFLLHNSAITAPVGRPPTQWQPPTHQQYKINFDGALFKVENQAGIGVVIRDSEGQVMVSLAHKSHCPIQLLKLMPWQLGVQWSWHWKPASIRECWRVIH